MSTSGVYAGYLRGLRKQARVYAHCRWARESQRSRVFCHTTSVACTAYLPCARRHLRVEIEHIAPGAVCFVGVGNAAPAAEELFGAKIGWKPHEAQLGSWSGLVAVAPQPVRGHEVRTKEIVAHLLKA